MVMVTRKDNDRRCQSGVLMAGLLIIGFGVGPLTQARAGVNETAPAEKSSGPLWLYVGTYTQGKTPSEGIYLLEMDPQTGRVINKGAVAKLSNPSFLAIHPGGKFVYAVNELGEFQGKKTGGVSALAIDPSSGKLTLVNQQSSVGNGPCHLTVDRAGKNVLVANYGSGSRGLLAHRLRWCVEPGVLVHPARGQGLQTPAARKAPTPTPSTWTGPITSPSRRTWASTRS